MMNVCPPHRLRPIVMFFSAAAIAAAAHAQTVSVDRVSFNPSLSETVAITVRTPQPSRVSIAVLDRDGFVTRTLASDAASTGTYVANWNGRDATGEVVADEAYSFKVDVASAAGHWTYFPATATPKSHAVQARRYSRQNASLLYDLPKAARVHAQAGSAARDSKTNEYDGPVLKTLVNREPRPAGAIVESWNGFDESGAVYIPDLPNFVTAILATELPENAVIAYGNRKRTFLEVAARRTGTSLLPPMKEQSHAHHHGLTALEDASPSLTVTPVGGAWDAQRKSWVVQGNKARMTIRLDGPTAERVARQPGRLIVFVDYVQKLERRVRKATETIEIPLGSRPAVVSINWQSDYGPLAANTVRVTSSRSTAALETSHEAR